MAGSIIKLAVKGFGKALKKKNPKLKRNKKGELVTNRNYYKGKRISNKPFTPDKPLKDAMGRRFVWEQTPRKGLTGKKIYKD